MLVQLIGAITGTEDYEIKFARAERELKVLGYKVVNPVPIGEKVVATHIKPKHEDFMKATIRSLVNVDAVCVIDGAETSLGVKQEIAVAEAIGLTFIDYKMVSKKW